MKKILLTGMMLCLTASFALASGLNFNWNTTTQCPTVQNANMTWDCLDPGANDGDFFMVCSVMPNIAVVGFNALDARIDGQSVGPVPAWWQGFNPGSCREAAFTPGLPPTTPTAPCAGNATTKLWTTAAYGGMGAWVYDASNRFHTVVGFATAANRAANLVVTTQYNAFNIEVLTTNSLDVPESSPGAGDGIVACAGCAEGMTLVLNQIGLYGSGAEDQVTLPGTTVGAKLCIEWQGGSGPGVCSATPSRNTTWGQVKSLYR
jgi:hypothetical protein